ncbi:hypothetical protein Cgig2_005852 [Carnegiea gigantea]|uniref:Uncharacterized protein n=1 Tax=Carnegiea gigantea TaxID=171969 RepID=A0A9Q1KKV9_9CARY|nr:hypothetical protein Cgig2_005852 [Carnegiea gigantea]
MSQKRPPPDPIAVLRGHRASVMDVCFHWSKPLLFTGSTDGELRTWDTIQHRTLSSARVHSAAHGIIAVASGPSLGEDKIMSQGRDGTVKLWDIENGALSREPLVTIRTNSYNFCKLSLVKKPTVQVNQVEHSTSAVKVPEDQPANSMGLNVLITKQFSFGLLVKSRVLLSFLLEVCVIQNKQISLLSIDEAHIEGSKYVAVAGEQSQVEIWDLNTAERCTTFPQGSSNDMMDNPARGRGLCMAVQAFIPSECQGSLNILAGYAFHVTVIRQNQPHPKTRVLSDGGLT